MWVNQCNDVEELVQSEYLSKIKTFYGLNSVQLMVWELAFRTADLDNSEDPLAHLVTDAGDQRYLTCLNADGDNREGLVGKTVPVDGSFFYDLFGKDEAVVAEETKALVADLQGLEGNPELGQSFVFEADVVNTARKYYFFTVPKFGSTLAFKLLVPTYTNVDSFTDLVAKTRQYTAEVQEMEEIKANEEREYQERLEKAQKEGEDTTAITEAYAEKVWTPIEKQPPVCEHKNYLLVMDNLGDDVPICREKLTELLQLCLTLKKTWEAKNLAKLEKNVEAYLALIDRTDSGRLGDFEKEWEAFQDSQRRSPEGAASQEAPANAPQEVNLTAQTTLMEAVALLAQKYAEVWTEFQELKEWTWVRLSEVIQLTLFALGLTKAETNIPGTNQISWTACAKNFELLSPENLAAYKYSEPKVGTYKSYQLTNSIHDRLQSLPWAEVGAYSFPLYILGQYTLTLLKLRLENVRVRRQDYAFKVEFRQKRMEMYRERTEKKKEELEMEKVKFYAAQTEGAEATEDGSPREKEEFDQAEWLAEWETQNPEVEIPEEPIIDTDNDISAEYVLGSA
jgi:hypothetical protein